MEYFVFWMKCGVSEMARYIEEEAFGNFVQEHFCNGCNNYNGVKCKSCSVDDAISFVESAPTADVVPKSEYIRQIAERQAAEEAIREILEEIEKSVASKIPMKIKPIFKNDLGFDAGVIDGKQDALFEVLVLIADLKKKYVPNTNDGNKVSSHDICVVCGESVPEGRQVCGMCEVGIDTLKKYNKNNNQGG